MQHIEYLSESSVTLSELSSIFLFFPFLVFIGEFLLTCIEGPSLTAQMNDWLRDCGLQFSGLYN